MVSIPYSTIKILMDKYEEQLDFMFQFLIVRLKYCEIPVVILCLVFQFLIVRLKYLWDCAGCALSAFQFLIVRLKYNQSFFAISKFFVSIPYSTIKIYIQSMSELQSW